MMRTILVAVVTGCMGPSAFAEELDYYRNLHYPSKLVPGVGLDTVEQEGGPDAVGYQRRAVQWWPRQGQDFVDVPEGAPLRTWTRNKGKENPEALAGVTCFKLYDTLKLEIGSPFCFCIMMRIALR